MEERRGGIGKGVKILQARRRRKRHKGEGTEGKRDDLQRTITTVRDHYNTATPAQV
jgi:hypothetical protein